MRGLKTVTLGLLMVAILVSAVTSYNTIPSWTSCCDCSTLMPLNFPLGTSPQVMPSPFKIVVNSRSYEHDNEVIVELVSDEGMTFRDFILVAWPTDHRKKAALGTFQLIDKDNMYTQKYECYNSITKSYAIMVADLKPKSYLRFTWQTRDYYGHVEFRATFIVSDDVYWVAEKSGLLIDSRPNAPPISRDSDLQKVTSPIDTSTCGDIKGCYRLPDGCHELVCYHVVTWREDGRNIRFELGGLTDKMVDRYIAVGLSNDTYMGEDIIFACAHSSRDGSTHVYLSYNDVLINVPLDRRDQVQQLPNVLTDVEGSYYNGRLRCRFTVERDLDIYYPELSFIASDYHLLVSHGFARDGVLRRHGMGVNELPVASPVRVDFSLKQDVGGRARYPLVKAHACLMILAWVFFASLGLIMAKYYKTMWPNDYIYDHRCWFITHFNCMGMVFLIVTTAVILIFVEADGWSVARDLPERAHPVLGIIIFICVIINPILALLRPPETSKCRPLFNWFHWAFGTIANVLAIPQIFIGMGFGKANVPWWATWIMVVWVIFHIIVEISLEVHQCCTYKKNKDRRRKYELQKRDNPKLHFDEPDPAGWRFKRFMLFLHLTVTTVVTVLLIVIIAVC